jgi:hypothetical protein
MIYKRNFYEAKELARIIKQGPEIECQRTNQLWLAMNVVGQAWKKIEEVSDSGTSQPISKKLPREADYGGHDAS